MHMEALDRSFSTSSDASLAMYPISPEPRYNECLSPQYSPIQYDEQLYDLPSPCTGVTPESSIDSAYMSSVSSRTPLSSTSSFSSDSNHNCLSSSHSSGLSEIPSLSSMSISSSEDSSSSSLFLNSSLSDTSISNNNNIINNNNPFNVVQTRSNKYKSRKNNTATVVNSNTNCSNSTQRRSSAPARGNSGSKNSDNPRKDSFVYDVQLEADNVLLFVPDLDLVKSHLMFAVREEVDVLKERIGELMERINHLEYENTVLRKYATPETLQQLQHPNP